MNVTVFGLVIDVRPVFAWYDLWLGAYYNRASGFLYLMVPMVGVRIGVWRAYRTSKEAK